MKNTPSMLKILTLFCSACLATAAFGQVTQVFDGHATGTNVDVATNYVGSVLPSANNGDTAEFDGVLPGNLQLNYVGNWQSGPGASGVNLYLTLNQTGSVTIDNLNGSANPPNCAIQNITIDPGAGAFQVGSDNHVFNYAGRPGGAIHQLINNSTNTAKIGAMFHMIAGGGTPFAFDFSGTGNWQVNSFLVTDNTPNNNTTVQVDSTDPGTVTWSPATPSTVGTLNTIAAVIVNSGTLILTTNYPKLTTQPFTINGRFQFNSPSQPGPQFLSGIFSGSGILQVSAGTLSLSGQSTFGGTNLLSGGELVANGSENGGSSGPLGELGVITFAGGVLGYSVNNTFDYSARFDTAAGQAYKIDTSGQSVAFSNALSSAGGTFTKLGAGTLTLAGANTYSGATTVSGGKLVIQRLAGSGSITVADGTALGLMENDSQITAATLTVGTSASATLEFNNVTNATVPPLVAGTISAAAPITINVNSGSFNTIGQSFPLLQWNGGSAPAVNLGIVSGAAGALSTNGNKIVLTITSTPYVWTGVNNGNWDTNTTGNWVQSGNPVVFANGALALFDDTATGTPNITISSVVQPSSITFQNDNLIYSIASSAGTNIAGSGGLTKNGNSVLNLSGGANTYTGATVINGGTVSVGVLAGGGSASDIGAASSDATNLVLNGGTLQYTNGAAATIDRLFTVGPGGGTIDSSGNGGLSLTNTGSVGLSGGGPRTLTLTGSAVDTNSLTTATNTLAANIANSSSGATAVTKSGPGIWVLTGTNSYSGLTTVNNGVLQIGVGGASGTVGSGNIDDNGGLDFNRTGTLTVAGVIAGSGTLTNDGPGMLILAGNNTYSGGTVINAGTVQIGTGGTSGSLNSGSQIIDNGTLIFNNKSLVTISGFGANISGTGNVRIATGTVKATGIDSYTGWTEIDTGATFQPSDGNAGAFIGLGSTITNNGTIFMTRQDVGFFGITNNIVGTGKVWVDTGNQNSGLVVLAGTNTYTGGTFIGGSGIVLGDGITTNAGTIIGSVVFTNTTGPTVNTFAQSKVLVLDRPDDYTFTNPVISHVSDGSSTDNSGSLVQAGPGTVTLTVNNSYIGTTTAGGGTLIVGNGGTSGSVNPAGGIVLTNNGTLVMNRSDAVNITGIISDGTTAGTGTGTFIQYGTGTTTLANTNTSLGPTVVSNGTLVVDVAVGGELDISGGTLIAGGLTSVTNVTVGGILNLTNGTLELALSPSSTPQSNTVITANGSINYVGGNIKLISVGPGLAVGQQYFLFSQSVPGGHLIPVTGQGFTVSNNLEGDGSVTVTSITPTQAPGIKQIQLSGTNVVITATNSTGTPGPWTLLSTNKVNAPLATWPVMATGNFDNTGSIAITNGVKAGQQFFILSVP